MHEWKKLRADHVRIRLDWNAVAIVTWKCTHLIQFEIIIDLCVECTRPHDVEKVRAKMRAMFIVHPIELRYTKAHNLIKSVRAMILSYFQVIHPIHRTRIHKRRKVSYSPESINVPTLSPPLAHTHRQDTSRPNWIDDKTTRWQRIQHKSSKCSSATSKNAMIKCYATWKKSEAAKPKILYLKNRR